ncbi:MAG: tetratricopeptide repeat protein [Gammaproteobacteria bacterium]|jgi:predicted negative regulator of RcsB-dependent stress response
METHTTEEQQIENLKKWWKENGGSIVTGVVLGLAILFGVKAWFAYQEREAETASNLYAVMMAALERNDARAVADKAGVLISDFSATPYAPLAAFALARIKIEADELDAARAQLQWALDHADSGVIRATARARMVRVLIAQGELDAAQKLLDQVPEDSGFEVIFRELQGDIHLARGETAQAEEAYRQALAGMESDSPGRKLLQLKYGRTRTQTAAGGETAP